jgi:uncharacterized membrane protein
VESNEQTIYSAVLKRPLSSSPKLLLGFMGSLSFVCLVIASAWAYVGATWVLVFALVDVLVLLAAVVWCVRHAMDFERINLTENTLTVERQLAGRLDQWAMQRFYVRLELIEVSIGPFKSPRLLLKAQQQSVVLGGFCHTAALRQLDCQLRLALKTR